MSRAVGGMAALQPIGLVLRGWLAYLGGLKRRTLKFENKSQTSSRKILVVDAGLQGSRATWWGEELDVSQPAMRLQRTHIYIYIYIYI